MALSKADTYIRWIRLNKIVLNEITSITFKPARTGHGKDGAMTMRKFMKSHAPYLRYHNPNVPVNLVFQEGKKVKDQILEITTKSSDKPTIFKKPFNHEYHILRTILNVEMPEHNLLKVYEPKPDPPKLNTAAAEAAAETPVGPAAAWQSDGKNSKIKNASPQSNIGSTKLKPVKKVDDE